MTGYTTKTLLLGACTLFQLGVNAAIFVIMSLFVQSSIVDVCLMSKDIHEVFPCNYAYVVAGIGCILNIIFFVLVSFSKDKLKILRVLVASTVFCWYSCGGVVLSIYVYEANAANTQQQGWRVTTLMLVWTNVVLSLVMIGINACDKKVKESIMV
jgi:hypothetical protein